MASPYVELVRELVDDEVHARGLPVGGGGDVGPGQHDGAALHRLASQRLVVAMHDARLVLPLPAGNELARIDDDVLEAVVPRDVPVEDENARLHRDQHALQRRDLVAARADDPLAVEEQDDELAQPRKLVVAISVEQRQRGERFLPKGVGDRQRRERPAPAPVA